MATNHSTFKGPHLGMLALIFSTLFIIGLSFVISFSGATAHFPAPWEPMEIIVSYFQNETSAVLMCAFFQFGAAIPLALFTATAVSRLKFLGTKAAGVNIAFIGGGLAAVSILISSLVLWVMTQQDVTKEPGVLIALYYLSFAIGGVGYSVPLGLLIAGITVTSGFMRLLPKWLIVLGIMLAVFGELSFLSLFFHKLLFFIPLTRFPGFVWLIIVGFKLPKTKTPTS